MKLKPSQFVVGTFHGFLFHMVQCSINSASVGCLDPRANPTDFFGLETGGISSSSAANSMLRTDS